MADRLGEALITIKLEVDKSSVKQKLSSFFRSVRKQVVELSTSLQGLEDVVKEGDIKKLEKTFRLLGQQFVDTGGDLSRLRKDFKETGESAKVFAQDTDNAVENAKAIRFELDKADRDTARLDGIQKYVEQNLLPASRAMSRLSGDISALNNSLKDLDTEFALPFEDGALDDVGFKIPRLVEEFRDLETGIRGYRIELGLAEQEQASFNTKAESIETREVASKIAGYKALAQAIRDSNRASSERLKFSLLDEEDLIPPIASRIPAKLLQDAENELLGSGSIDRLEAALSNRESGTPEFKKFEDALKRAKREANKLEDAIEPLNAEIRKSDEAIEGFQESVRQNTVGPFTKNIERLERSVSTTSKKLKELKEKFESDDRDGTLFFGGSRGVALDAIKQTENSLKRQKASLDKARKLQKNEIERIVKESKDIAAAEDAINDKLLESAKQLKIAAGEINAAGEFLERTDIKGTNANRIRDLDKAATAELNRERGEKIGRGFFDNQRIADARKEFLSDVSAIREFGRATSATSAQINSAISEAGAKYKQATGFFSVFNKTAFRQAQTLRELGFSISDAGRQLLFFSTATLGSFIPAIQQFAQFEQSVANVAAVFGDFDRFKTNVDALSESFLRLGEVTEFTANEIADAARSLALAGFSAREVQEAIGDVVNLASAGNLSPEEASGFFSTILRAFNIDASDADRVSDVLATIATESNTTVSKLGESFKLLAPISANLGQSLEDVSSALGVLGNAGIAASRAGTGLSRAFSELLEKQDDFDEFLKGVGSSFEALDPTKNSIVEIIGELERLQAAGQIDTADFFELFDQRSARVIVTLVNQGATALEELSQKAEESAGAAEKIREARLDTLFGDFRILISSLQTLFVELGATFGDIGRNLVQTLSATVRSLARFVKEWEVTIKTLGIAVATIGTLGLALGALTISVGAILRVIAGVKQISLWVDALRNWKDIARVTAAVNKALTFTIVQNTTASTANAAAMTASAGATTALGRAAAFATGAVRTLSASLVFLASNPLVAILTGLGLVITGLVLMSEEADAAATSSLVEYADSIDRATRSTDALSAATQRFQKDLDLLRKLPSLNTLQLEQLTQSGGLLTKDLDTTISEAKQELDNTLSELQSSLGTTDNNSLSQYVVRFKIKEDEDGTFQLVKQLLANTNGSSDAVAARFENRVFGSEVVDIEGLDGASRRLAEIALIQKGLVKDLQDAKPQAELFKQAYSNGLDSLLEVRSAQRSLNADLDIQIQRLTLARNIETDSTRQKALDREILRLTSRREIVENNIEALDRSSKSSAKILQLSKEILESKLEEEKLIKDIANGDEAKTEQLKTQVRLTEGLLDTRNKLTEAEKEAAKVRKGSAEAVETLETQIEKLRQQFVEREGTKSVQGIKDKLKKEFEGAFGKTSLIDFLRDNKTSNVSSLSAEALASVRGKNSPLGILDQEIIAAELELANIEATKESAIARLDRDRQDKALNEIKKLRADGASEEQIVGAIDAINAAFSEKIKLASDTAVEATNRVSKRLNDTRTLNTELRRLFIKEEKFRVKEFEEKQAEEAKKQAEEAAKMAEKKEKEREEIEKSIRKRVDQQLKSELEIAKLKGEQNKILELRRRINEREAKEKAKQLTQDIKDDAVRQQRQDEIVAREKEILELTIKKEQAEKEKTAQSKAQKKILDDIRKSEEDIQKDRLDLQKKTTEALFSQVKSVKDLITLTKFLNRQEAIRSAGREKFRQRTLSFERRLRNLSADATVDQRSRAISNLGAAIDVAKRAGLGANALVTQVEAFSAATGNRLPAPQPPVGPNVPRGPRGGAGFINNNISVDNFNINIQADSISDADDVIDAIRVKEKELRNFLFGGNN
jgi:TP901 family phage tail tape measure protein